MAGDTNIPGEPDAAKRRTRKRRFVMLAACLAVIACTVFVVVGPPRSANEREVEKLLAPVRQAERNEKPFYRWVAQFKDGSAPLREVSRWILGENTSNQPINPTEALHDLGDPVVPILLRLAVKDSSPAVRAVAIETLGALSSTNAFAPAVQSLVSDPAVTVRTAAAGALSLIDPRTAGPLLLGALGREKDESVRVAIVSALGNLEPAVVLEPLLQILKNDPSEETRRAAAEALGQLGDTRAAPALRSLLSSDKHNLLVAAIEALGELRDRESVPQLLALLDTAVDAKPIAPGSPASLVGNHPPDASFQSWQYDSVRRAIAQALGRIGDARATDSLTRALPSLADEWEFQTFLDALGAIGDPKAIPALRAVIADQPKYSARAAQVLGRIGNADTTRELIALLDSPDRETRVASAIALANLGEKAAVTNLLHAMTTGPQSDAKRNIVEALGVVGDPSAVSQLVEAARDTDQEVRTQAVWALGNIGDPAASDALLHALKDAAFGVRFAGAFALAGMTNTAALPALELMLNDQERRARTAAACSLAFHGSERGLPQLALALKRLDDWQRFAAIAALLRLNTAAARELANNALQDRDRGVRKLATEGLELGAVPALVNALKSGSDDHRHYAARLLLFFNDPAAIPALQPAMRDTEMEVRVAARVTLRRIERTQAAK